MKILVTGSEGFIGKNLIEEIKNVFNMDIIFRFDIKRTAKEDIRVFYQLEEAMKNVDIVIHLAALCKETYISNPIKCFDTNVLGTWNALEAARINKVSHVIFTSSAAVDVIVRKIPFEYKQQSPYGLSKVMCENLCKFYREAYDMKIATLRLFNVYGKWNNKGVIKKIFDCIRNRKKFTLYNGGEEIRDYIHVDDVCKAILNAIKYRADGLFEIGTGFGYNTKQVVGMIEEITGEKVKIKKIKIPNQIQKSICNIPLLTSIPIYDGLVKLWEE